MPITFTDWAYGNRISYDYEDELARWDTNINTMAVGELILNDIILVSARNVADIEDQSGLSVTFSDKAGAAISLADKNGGSATTFTDYDRGATSFTDWTKL